MRSLGSEATRYLRLHVAGIKVGAQEGIHTLLYGVLVAVTGTILTIVAAVLLPVGFAGMVAALAGGRLWVGCLVTGASILVGAVLGLRILRARMRARVTASLVATYGRPSTRPDRSTGA